MITSKYISLLESNPLNFFLKQYSRLLTQKCPSCSQKPFDRIIAKWNQKPISFCFRCQPIYSLTEFVFNRFLGLTEKELTNFAQNPLYRRSLLAWLSGIGKFGFNRPQPTLPPIAVVWNFTNSCNLKCTHCYSDSNSISSTKELTTTESLKVVDYFISLGSYQR